ncbi:MAG: ATP-binding protein, partial [Halobacteria archaeon]|nr:ATP-binding protein [Halobacteria archaeon]
PPDRDARKEIAKIHLSDRPVSKELDWDLILEKTEGYTASDIELVAENAAREALKEDSSISTEHLVRAAENTQSSLRN